MQRLSKALKSRRGNGRPIVVVGVLAVGLIAVFLLMRGRG